MKVHLSEDKNENGLFYLIQSGSDMIWQAWKARPNYFIGIIFIEIFQGIIPLGSAWTIKNIFDFLANNLRSIDPITFSPLIPLFIANILLGVIGQSLYVFSTYLNSELGRQLTLNIQYDVNKKISSIDGLAPFDDPKFYNTIQQAVQGAQMGPQQMVTMIAFFTRSVITLLGSAWLLITFSPTLTGLILLVSGFQLFNGLKFGKQRFNLELLNSPKERQVDYYNNILSGINFAKEVRLFGLSNYFLTTFYNTYKGVNDLKSSQELKELKWQLIIDIASSLISSGALIIVILQALRGTISAGSVLLYTSIVGNVQIALSGIAFSYSTLNENAIFYSKFKELLDLPESLHTPTSIRSLPPLSVNIELRNVSFRYNSYLPWVLHKINLIIPVGQSLAFVGLNGAGKTTLVKLLTRLYDPTEGQILWDGIDIREFDIKEFRQKVSVIFQDFVHFDITAYENIAVGDLTKIEQPEYIFRAAQKSGIHNVIEKLPKGYQTLLSRWLSDDDQGNGIDLSGGEWQKIALARMLVRQANFLILDEPTSSLDSQAEAILYENFLELMKGKTSVLISHRFGTVRMAHKIAVLKDSKIVEFGTHEELIAMKGFYSYLFNLHAQRNFP